MLALGRSPGFITCNSLYIYSNTILNNIRSYHLPLFTGDAVICCAWTCHLPRLSVDWGKRCLALGCQRSLRLLAVDADARRANATINPIADDDGITAAGARDVEVLHRDVVADGIGVRRAGQLRDRVAVDTARVARKVLEQDVGHVHAGWVLLAGGLVDLGPMSAVLDVCGLLQPSSHEF